MSVEGAGEVAFEAAGGVAESPRVSWTLRSAPGLVEFGVTVTLGSKS